MNKVVTNLFFLTSLVTIVSCANSDGANNEKAVRHDSAANLLAPKENFNDTLNGKSVGLFYLKNKDMAASITNYGGRVVNLLVPDKNGVMTDVAIGFDSF
jgi:aldose 1-epimerase